MADKIQIEIELQAREAKRQAKEIEKACDDIEKKGRSLGQTLVSVGVQGAQGIGMIGAAATVAVAAGYKLAEMAAEADRSARSFDLLGSAYSHVERATNGAVSAQVALRAQQTLVQSGLRLTGEQLGTITRAAREYALATGTETTQAVEQLTDALRGGEAEGLRRFGVALQDTGDRSRNVSQALDALATAQRGHATAALTATENLERFRAGLSHLANDSASFVAGAGTRLLNWWGRITGGGGSTFSDLVREIGEAPSVDAANRRNAATNAEQERRAAAESLRQRRIGRVFQNGVPDAILQRLGPRRVTSELLDSFVSYADPITGELSDAAIGRYYSDQERRQRAIAAQAMTEERRRKKNVRGEPSRGGGGGGSSARRAMSFGPTRVDEFFNNYLAGESPDAYWNRRLTEAANATTTQSSESDDLLTGISDGISRQRREQNDRATRRAERNRRDSESARLSTMGGRIQAGLGVSSDFLATQAKLADGYADMTVGAFGKIGNAMIEHIALVIQGKETLGEALLSGANQVSTALAMEAAPKALMELAAGFAALANPITAATAPLHFTAAGIYGGVAAGAGLVSLGTGAAMASAKAPSGAGAADTRRSSSLAPRSSSQSSQNAAPVTINVSSLIPPGPRELQTLAQAVKQSDRYGLNKQSPRPVRV